MRKVSLPIRFLALAFALAAVLPVWAFKPVEWKNLDNDHHLGGRVASGGYLRGKIVLVDCRDYGDKKGLEAMLRLQEIWSSFKTKPFVLIGSHRGAAGKEKIERISRGLGLTFPIYAGAAMAAEPAEAAESDGGFIYVVDIRGTVIYRGNDDRSAVSAVASSILAMKNPQTQKQWEYLLDFDLDVLPGRALNGLKEYRRAFPEDFKDYEQVYKELSEDKDIQRLAKLEEFSQQVKDSDRNDKSSKRVQASRLKEAIKKFESLKTCADPFCAQEAKNCIADIVWALAAIEAE
ncbi:MAG: hypothetical protein ILO34_02075 [Kiritimatiellae bacterium]|nr:hypothetical protein [Kiritimatiellia bacterium]